MGVLGVFKESVTLVNRTNRKLNVRYDGEDITVLPGDNPGFPRVAVPYAKAQNILMGSRHPVNASKYISLVGVKNTKDDVSEIPVEVLAAADKKMEAVDRSGEFWNRPMRQNVKLLNREYEPEEAGVLGSFMDSNGTLDKALG